MASEERGLVNDVCILPRCSHSDSQNLVLASLVNQDLAGELKLQILRRGDHPRLSKWAPSNHKSFYMRKIE